MECTAVKDFSSFELCEYLVKQGLLCKSDAEVLESKKYCVFVISQFPIRLLKLTAAIYECQLCHQAP